MDWLNLPSLNALKAFAVLAEARSYTRAGEALNVTHAAVMQQVRALENHLSVELVSRSGRGVALTAEGEKLAGDLLAGFIRLHRGVARANAAGHSRPVQVTTSPAFATKWLMPRLEEFHHKHPEITMMLNPTGQIVDLKSAEIDLAIRYGFYSDLPEGADILLEVDLVVVGAPGLVVTAKTDTPADLIHLPWLQELGTNEVGDWLARQNVTIDRPLMISHMPGNLIMDAVVRGGGLTYTVREWVRKELESGELVELFAENKCGAFYLVAAGAHPRVPVERFTTWLITLARDQPD